MTKTERTLTREAAQVAVWLYTKTVKNVGWDKAAEEIDPTDHFYMQMLVKEVVNKNSKRHTNFIEGLSEKREQEFYANIADAANGGIRWVKANPELYGL